MLTGIRYTAALPLGTVLVGLGTSGTRGGYARGDGHSAEANLRHQTCH